MEKKGILTRRIPTILGILILLAGLITGIVLVGQQQGFSINAGPTAVPKNIKIANRGSNSITITWTTDVPVTGFVKYSDNPTKLTLPAGDTRDQIAGSTTAYTTHYVDITGLTADKTYYFEIGSGSKSYNDANKPYQVRTTVSAASPTEDVISGKVVGNSGGVNGAIVFAEVNGGETLAALTKNDGTWRINLATARDKTGKFLNYDRAKEIITLTIQAGAAGTATAITNTATDNPVPEITLGKTHNFAGETVISALGSGSPTSGAGFGQLVESIEPPEVGGSASDSVKLLNPGIEGEKISVTKPEFIGSGPEGLSIKLSLNTIPVQTGYATPSAAGSWVWTSPTKLDLGFYTLSWEFKDSKGETQKNNRGFEIIAASSGSSGGLPAFTATPSATPSVGTPSATPTPTKAASGSGTATDSGELKDAGVLTPTYALFIVGIGLFVSGVFWKKKWA